MAVTLSLKQLLTPVTPEQALASVLGTLGAFGFAATSWQSGSKQLTMVQTLSKVYSDLTYTVADITNSGFALLARGAYADQLGIYSYKLTRIAATQTIGTMVLTSSAGAPINNWVDGQILISDKPPGSLNANVFRVSGPGTLNPGTSTTITVKGDVPGSAANIPPGVTLYLWGGGLTGVTVTNPAIAGTSTWITTPGTDPESDERYGQRMVGRWSALTYGNTDGAYTYWALTALPALTRLTITRDPLVQGSVNVIGATALGGLTAPQITTITNYIQGTVDNVGRRPINDILTVASATVDTTPALTITVACASQFATDAAARVKAALIAMFGAMPIGGKKLPASNIGYVLLADMYATVMAQTGILNVTGLPPDIALGVFDVYTPAITVNVVPV
jgi:hypothetical protein